MWGNGRRKNESKQQFIDFVTCVAGRPVCLFSVRLTDNGVLALVPAAAEVKARQLDRAKQLRNGERRCRYIETAWHGYIVYWCP